MLTSNIVQRLLEILLQEARVDLFLGLVAAHERLLEPVELLSQSLAHLRGLALVEELGRPDIGDLLQAPVELVVQVVDLLGAPGEARSEPEGLLADLLVALLLDRIRRRHLLIAIRPR